MYNSKAPLVRSSTFLSNKISLSREDCFNPVRNCAHLRELNCIGGYFYCQKTLFFINVKNNTYFQIEPSDEHIKDLDDKVDLILNGKNIKILNTEDQGLIEGIANAGRHHQPIQIISTVFNIPPAVENSLADSISSEPSFGLYENSDSESGRSRSSSIDESDASQFGSTPHYNVLRQACDEVNRAQPEPVSDDESAPHFIFPVNTHVSQPLELNIRRRCAFIKLKEYKDINQHLKNLQQYDYTAVCIRINNHFIYLNLKQSTVVDDKYLQFLKNKNYVGIYVRAKNDLAYVDISKGRFKFNDRLIINNQIGLEIAKKKFDDLEAIIASDYKGVMPFDKIKDLTKDEILSTGRITLAMPVCFIFESNPLSQKAILRDLSKYYQCIQDAGYLAAYIYYENTLLYISIKNKECIIIALTSSQEKIKQYFNILSLKSNSIKELFEYDIDFISRVTQYESCQTITIENVHSLLAMPKHSISTTPVAIVSDGAATSVLPTVKPTVKPTIEPIVKPAVTAPIIRPVINTPDISLRALLENLFPRLFKNGVIGSGNSGNFLNKVRESMLNGIRQITDGIAGRMCTAHATSAFFWDRENLTPIEKFYLELMRLSFIPCLEILKRIKFENVSILDYFDPERKLSTERLSVNIITWAFDIECEDTLEKLWHDYVSQEENLQLAALKAQLIIAVGFAAFCKQAGNFSNFCQATLKMTQFKISQYADKSMGILKAASHCNVFCREFKESSLLIEQVSKCAELMLRVAHIAFLHPRNLDNHAKQSYDMAKVSLVAQSIGDQGDHGEKEWRQVSEELKAQKDLVSSQLTAQGFAQEAKSLCDSLESSVAGCTELLKEVESRRRLPSMACDLLLLDVEPNMIHIKTRSHAVYIRFANQLFYYDNSRNSVHADMGPSLIDITLENLRKFDEIVGLHALKPKTYKTLSDEELTRSIAITGHAPSLLHTAIFPLDLPLLAAMQEILASPCLAMLPRIQDYQQQCAALHDKKLDLIDPGKSLLDEKNQNIKQIEEFSRLASIYKFSNSSEKLYSQFIKYFRKEMLAFAQHLKTSVYKASVNQDKEPPQANDIAQNGLDKIYLKIFFNKSFSCFTGLLSTISCIPKGNELFEDTKKLVNQVSEIVRLEHMFVEQNVLDLSKSDLDQACRVLGAAAYINLSRVFNILQDKSCNISFSEKEKHYFDNCMKFIFDSIKKFSKNIRENIEAQLKVIQELSTTLAHIIYLVTLSYHETSHLPGSYTFRRQMIVRLKEETNQLKNSIWFLNQAITKKLFEMQNPFSQINFTVQASERPVEDKSFYDMIAVSSLFKPLQAESRLMPRF